MESALALGIAIPQLRHAAQLVVLLLQNAGNFLVAPALASMTNSVPSSFDI
jgi:hypothetical protein